MTQPTAPAVYAAIAAVQAAMASSGIGKTQVNQHDRYRFRGIDDVYNALAPALSKAGLVILPRYTHREVTERSSKSGSAMFCVTLRAEFDFVATKDGSSHTVIAYGEAMDRADKATPKAMAAAYKYACFQAFCIPTEGTPDADSETPDVDLSAVITTAQAASIGNLLEQTGSDTAKFCAVFRCDSVETLPASAFDPAMKALREKVRRIKKDQAQSADSEVAA